MKGRFDEGLKRMKLGMGVRIALHVDAQRRKQYALAERIASAQVGWDKHPDRWQILFNSALREIQQFDQEFEEVGR